MAERTSDIIEGWANAVRRLLAVAPIGAVASEVGTMNRGEAIRVVDEWVAKDVATLDAARETPEGHWSVEPGDEDHNPWVLRDGQRIAEVWGPDDTGSEADARTIVDALNDAARETPADLAEPSHTITPDCGPICWTTGHHHDPEACDGCRRLADTFHAAGVRAAPPSEDAARLDVERLARALAVTVLMQRYAACANTQPTLRHGTPEFHAKEWAPFIAREYDALASTPAAPTQPAPEAGSREALDLIVKYGGTDGAHHKAWVIDQVARLLAGPEYERIVADARAGEDGPNTYEWDEGIAP